MDYKYDAKEDSWCRLTVAIPVTNSVLDPQSLIEAELKKAVLHQAPSIKKSFLTRGKDGVLRLITEGVNFDYLLRHSEVLQLDRLFSNDIQEFQGVASRFGIEAAAKTIIRVGKFYRTRQIKSERKEENSKFNEINQSINQAIKRSINQSIQKEINK